MSRSTAIKSTPTDYLYLHCIQGISKKPIIRNIRGNFPLNLVDPSGMLGIPTGVGCLAAGLAVGSCSLDQQTQGMPPPPGGPASAGPTKIEIGPVPLPEGQEPWPTTLEIIDGPNKVY